jgi:vacuolar protein sorting-associated protein 54
MLRDAEHFKSKIGGLDGAGDAGDYLVGLVNAKIVPKQKQPITKPGGDSTKREPD